MISKSVGSPPVRRPSFPSPAPQDATRVIPKQIFSDDVEHLHLPRDSRGREVRSGDIARARRRGDR
jgi:hypothetical protein